jgi:hypothetical protein
MWMEIRRENGEEVEEVEVKDNMGDMKDDETDGGGKERSASDSPDQSLGQVRLQEEGQGLAHNPLLPPITV